VAFLVAVLAVPLRALAAPAGPDTLPIAVLSVKTDDALEHAGSLTEVLRKAVRNSAGWSLGSGNQALEFLALQLNCSAPIDAACEARIADVIKADRFIWAVLAFVDGGKAVVGSVNFFERGKGTNKAPVRYSANLKDANDDALIKIATEVVAAITGGPPKGALRVTTTGVAGQLYIDGEPLGALPGDGMTVQLAAGKHTVVARAAGHADAEMTVVIKPGSTIEIALKLEKVGESRPTDARMMGGFIGVGLGVAAGAVGLWGALEVNKVRTDDQYEGYRKQFSGETVDDVCVLAGEGREAPSAFGAASAAKVQGLCSKAKTGELVQAIAFPVAAIAAGAGAYLLGTSSLFSDGKSDDQSDAGWSIEPTIGPTLQQVSVTYRF
jgi:hypothetical protein